MDVNVSNLQESTYPIKKIPTLEEEKNPVESDFHEDKKKMTL